VNPKENPINWFEIPVHDLNRAKTFYEQVFETRLDVFDMGEVRMAWFPRPENTVGSSGGLIQAPGRTPARTGTVVFFSVPDIDATLAAVEKHGGKIVMPKTSGGEHGAIAHFEDSEGNLVALFSNR
jgi:predicted enzyme related to lactoylglutathione lyase